MQSSVFIALATQKMLASFASTQATIPNTLANAIDIDLDGAGIDAIAMDIEP